MKLTINNFAKIKHAEITVDGITVIAGENNTGKSTIGKILFSVFHSLNGIEDKIEKERWNNIYELNRDVIRNHIFLADLSVSRRNVPSIAIRRLTEYFKSYYYENKLDLMTDQQILDAILHYIKSVIRVRDEQIELLDGSQMARQIRNNIKQMLDLSEDKIYKEVISAYFREVFYGQTDSLVTSEDAEAQIDLTIKNKTNRMVFHNNICVDYEGTFNILHNAICVDNPFVIDALKEMWDGGNLMENKLLELLSVDNKEDIVQDVIKNIQAKEKLESIMEYIRQVVDGDIEVESATGEYYLRSNHFKKPIALHNLSTGMKSFMVLKMLIENGGLKERDVLILDEPEIHLHPQWQIAYAELIVLLQKEFDLSVVVTTHSPYFVDAIDLFSRKYQTASKVNYYLSSMEDDSVTLQCETDNIENIYRKMVSPIEMLDSLRHELDSSHM